MTRPAKLRTVWLVRQDTRALASETTPTVSIDVLRDGVITYGVKAVGKTLRDARQQAEREFLALRNFVTAIKFQLPVRAGDRSDADQEKAKAPRYGEK